MISLMPPARTAARYYDPDAKACHQLAKTALEIGWPRRELPTLRRIAARESLCNNTAYNGRDPYGGSYCALQLNGSNKRFLIAAGAIRSDMEELRALPSRCLRGALALWKRHGWKPWAGASHA
jgi:hypothetical protein